MVATSESLKIGTYVRNLESLPGNPRGAIGVIIGITLPWVKIAFPSSDYKLPPFFPYNYAFYTSFAEQHLIIDTIYVNNYETGDVELLTDFKKVTLRKEHYGMPSL